MHQQPAIVWNTIAETQPLRTDWAKMLFPMPQDQMDEALGAEAKSLAESLGSEKLAAAYLSVAPLLWEVRAILAFKATGDRMSDGLTPLETTQEAVIAASRDYALTIKEQRQLSEKLSTPPEI